MSFQEKNEVYEVPHELGSIGREDSADDINSGIRTGTSEDAADMFRLGKKQEFKVPRLRCERHP